MQYAHVVHCDAHCTRPPDETRTANALRLQIARSLCLQLLELPNRSNVDPVNAILTCTARFQEYQVIGRHLPSEANPTPKIYRMRIFAPNDVVAKSRFWYFLGKLRKIKKANGEIISLNQITEKRPQKVKNFGIWIRYDSRSGTHNMYKEYREMSRVAAVDALYQDMAARHRSRFRSVQILKVVELEKTDDVRRPYIKQLLVKGLKFPLPHRINKKAGKKVFASKRPSTFF
ncbi:60s ribosomal protein l20 [Stagonosporopsis vannaccii]|nr:60s ribosomal protein l20 [Stagonosporopsis vannaccii]